MTTLIPHWIRGAEAPGTSGRTAPVHNPATGEQTAPVSYTHLTLPTICSV